MTTENRPKNVVLILADHHRWDYLGCAGNAAISTPCLDAFAQAGTQVTGMHSTTPLCVPQRIAITAGRYAMNTGCYTNRHPVPHGIPTFLQGLRSAEVHTALIGKFHHFVHVLDGDVDTHAEEIRALGFDEICETSGKVGSGLFANRCRFTEFLAEKNLLETYRAHTGRFGGQAGLSAPNDPWPLDDDTTQDAFIASRACEFLRKPERKNEPFYLQVGMVGPHPPFDAPKRFREAYSETLPPGPHFKPDDTEPWRAYAACISEVDELVGRILLTLDEAGLREDTLILYSSDHGDNAGSRGMWGKGNFYEGSIRVPFLAQGPGVRSGARVEALAELIDLGATICDFLGVPTHRLDQGVSLLPVLTGKSQTHRTEVFAEMGSDKMLCDGRYKLMFGDVTRDRRKEYFRPPYNNQQFGRPVNLPPDLISLYDLKEDPFELRNLADDPRFRSLLEEKKEALLIRMIRNLQSVPEDTRSAF